MALIVPDAEVFMQFTEKSKQQYSRIWAHFRDFVAEVDFETGPPGEEYMYMQQYMYLLVLQIS